MLVVILRQPLGSEGRCDIDPKKTWEREKKPLYGCWAVPGWQRLALVAAIVTYTIRAEELDDMEREGVITIDGYRDSLFAHSVLPRVLVLALAGVCSDCFRFL